MVILDLDLVSCYTSILLGLYPDDLRSLQIAVEGKGLWATIKEEMERNGCGHVYNKAAVKVCVYSSFFQGGNPAMMKGILEHFRKELGITEAQFKRYPDYKRLYKVTQEVTSEMQNSSVIVDLRAVSEWLRKSHVDEFLEGPTGHRYYVSDETFRSAYPSFLISYEFALLGQATCETLEHFQSAELIGHYHDGNVVIVPLDEKDHFLDYLSERIRDIGFKIGLRYAQKIEIKNQYPSLPDKILPTIPTPLPLLPSPTPLPVLPSPKS